MTSKRIHIVSFDVPVPPDYGGVLDIYLRCKTLRKMGFYVVLHAYEYGRGRSADTREIADEIYYYDRHTNGSSLFSSLPYIVQSRNSRKLLHRLKEDDAPIILEGQHNTYWIHALCSHNRIVAVRMHNVEWLYYRNLAHTTKNTFQRLFFRMESRKLKLHEKKLRKAPLLCISQADTDYYRNLGYEAYLLPVSLDTDFVLTPRESNGFALFHGNLSVSENVDAVLELIRENKRLPLPVPVIIAGKNPGKTLKNKIEAQGWTCIGNPSDEALDELLTTCQVHLLIGSQKAGVKLKLLRAVLTGKPCIATPEMVWSSGVQDHCLIWDRQVPLAETLTSISENPETNMQERMNYLLYEHGPKRLEEVLQAIGVEKQNYI